MTSEYSSPDEVCAANSDESVALVLRLLMPDDDEGPDAVPTVLIEGERKALKFLASLLIAVADGDETSFQLSPAGAGSFHFDSKAELGVYVHRAASDGSRSHGTEV